MDSLDKGIRRTDEWLQLRGFVTTDSGDGSKAETMECAMDIPNVAIAIDHPAYLCRAANLLRGLIEAHVQLAPGDIQASYDPVDGSSVILLLNVDDARLFGLE